jgi:hypothetical protein
MTDPPPDQPATTDLLDDLTAELAVVRGAASALDLEPHIPRLPRFSAVDIVLRRARAGTTLAVAQVVMDLVREAAGRLGGGHEDRLARLLFRADPSTRGLDPPAARRHAQAASGVEMRQFRARWERRLCRLVAGQIMEMQFEADNEAHALHQMVGSVPQIRAMFWLDLFRDYYLPMETATYGLSRVMRVAIAQHQGGGTLADDLVDLVLWWAAEFVFVQSRFEQVHGELWPAPSNEGGEVLAHAAHDLTGLGAIPPERLTELRQIRARLSNATETDFIAELGASGIAAVLRPAVRLWLAECACGPEPVPGCPVHRVLQASDRFSRTVVAEFEVIRSWYRLPLSPAEGTSKAPRSKPADPCTAD